LLVRDIDEALDFYAGKLGLRPLRRYDGYASIQVGNGVEIGLHTPHVGHDHAIEQGGMELSFLVDDVDRWYSALAVAGIGFTRPPEDTPYGTREAYLKDPDGHVLTLKSRRP
jgi:catechol 2,3-dioxygenase-like lactoylglutathione lyase family enzyme